MNPKELEENYQQNKEKFHNYIDNIKKDMKVDIYNIVNPTLIKNPYSSEFPKRFFTNNTNIPNKYILFIKNTIKFYVKNIYLLSSYFIAFIMYKIYYKKEIHNSFSTIIDVFALVEKNNKSGKFNENYLTGVYEIFKKHKIPYAILLRPYGIGKNPFILKKFFKILNNDKRDFILEYEFLSLVDFVKIAWMIFIYPFKVLRLLQKGNTNIDEIFNYSLIYDIKYFNFESLTRYILGINLAQNSFIKKIYSWSEFQVIERSFNYAIRKYSDVIKLNALQFYLNYETYFNAYIDDIDEDLKIAPHKVFVNGKYYIQERDRVSYLKGVSLRYKSIFLFNGIEEEKHILLLGSYIETDTKYMLDSVKDLDNIIFKNHPAVDINKFGNLPINIKVSNENIYNLFKNTELAIGTASGTSAEAVACGVSVIIMASLDNLTANPLIKFGKGKIWDIAFSKNDVKRVYNNLIKYRKNNIKEIKQIASWYKENFFIEPTEGNIVNFFELDKD